MNCWGGGHGGVEPHQVTFYQNIWRGSGVSSTSFVGLVGQTEAEHHI